MYKHVLPRLAACCAAVLSTAALASPAIPPALTLAAAQAKVMQHSPALQALAHEAQAQNGLVRQAGVIPNPELSALVEDRQSATRTTTIQLTQPIELGGKRGARIAAAEVERELAAAMFEAKRAELRASTSAAFHTLLAAQARLELTEAGLTLVRQSLSGAAARVAAGKNSPVDETRARIAVSGAEIEILQVRGDADNARETLAALWGGSGQEVDRVQGRLDQLPDVAPLAALLERLQQAPAVARAQMALRRRIALGQVESARRMPDLAVTIGSKKDEQLGRRQAVFGVSVPLPLFDRNQGRIAEASQRTAQARDELTAAQAALASELRIAHTRLAVASAQARSLQDGHLPAARSTYDAARTGYEYGKFNILDVFDAQRVLLQAQAQHLRALADAHGAAAEIERILGAPGAIQP
jgi:cobalt-zinc-cadmium efflux system outer membrane protein